MASLYKNNGIWYVSTLINGTRKTKSLKTKERKKAFEKCLPPYRISYNNQII